MREYWIKSAVLSLALSGLFSLCVVLLRLPIFASAMPDIFNTSLVIHVSLGINTWMLSINSSIWQIPGKFRYYLATAGIILIFISGLIPGTEAIKNNYIPFLNNLPYVTGITLFFFAMLLEAILILLNKPAKLEYRITGIILIIAELCMLLAYLKMPYNLSLQDFYETLTWGGGHILQFVFCQTLMCIYSLMHYSHSTDYKIKIFSCFNLIVTLPVPFLYFFYTPSELVTFFTYHMRIVGSFAVIVYTLNILFSKHIKYPIVFSFLLFAYGGLLGMLIRESNVTVPAHYHGSIIGITIALMGFVYHTLGILQKKIPYTQLILYTAGHFIHITALSFMGGYGALRKTAGMVGSSTSIYKILFIIGGVVSIIAGGLFIVISVREFIRRR